MLKWIVFDAMGVIYTEGDDVKEWVYQFLKERNEDVTLEELKSFYVDAALGNITSTEFFEHYKIENPSKAMYEYTKHYPKMDEKFTNVAMELSENYHLAMLSNDVDEWSRLLRRRFGLDRLLEKTIVSGNVHVRKPDRQIYILAISELDAMPEECLFIDDKERNLIPAREIGFNVLRFNRDNKKEKLNNGIDDISSFDELIPYIKNKYE